DHLRGQLDRGSGDTTGFHHGDGLCDGCVGPGRAHAASPCDVQRPELRNHGFSHPLLRRRGAAPNGNLIVATTTPTFPDFPLGVTLGSYDRTLDLTQASSFNPVFVMDEGNDVTQAEAALVAAIEAGTAYLNIHTSNFPSG